MPVSRAQQPPGLLLRLTQKESSDPHDSRVGIPARYLYRASAAEYRGYERPPGTPCPRVKLA
eukprot:336529-Rhodomonas_salina.2